MNDDSLDSEVQRINLFKNPHDSQSELNRQSRPGLGQDKEKSQDQIEDNGHGLSKTIHLSPQRMCDTSQAVLTVSKMHQTHGLGSKSSQGSQQQTSTSKRSKGLRLHPIILKGQKQNNFLFETDSYDDQSQKKYISSDTDKSLSKNTKKRVKVHRHWKMDSVAEEEGKDSMDPILDESTQHPPQQQQLSHLEYYMQQRDFDTRPSSQMVVQEQLRRRMDSVMETGNSKKQAQMSSIMKRRESSMSKKSVQFVHDEYQESYDAHRKLSTLSSMSKIQVQQQQMRGQSLTMLRQNSDIQEEEDNNISRQSKNFRQVFYNVKEMWAMFLDEGFMLEEKSDETKLYFEFADSSHYIGEYPRDNNAQGSLQRKKGSISYIQKISSKWMHGMPNGESEIQLLIRNWPKYHWARSLKQRQQLSIKGAFKNGQLDGHTQLKDAANKQLGLLKYHKGLETPLTQNLKDMTTDRLWLNASMCIMVWVFIILGMAFDMNLLFGSLGLYMLQILEYFCSSTRHLLQTQESLDLLINTIQEYRKWRPVLYFHFKNQDEQNIQSKQQVKMAPIDEESDGNASQLSLDFQTLKSAKQANDAKDLLDEFRYREWQDQSPDPQAIKELEAGIIKINIYKLFDISTRAQAELNKRKKMFAQYAYGKVSQQTIAKLDQDTEQRNTVFEARVNTPLPFIKEDEESQRQIDSIITAQAKRKTAPVRPMIEQEAKTIDEDAIVKGIKLRKYIDGNTKDEVLVFLNKDKQKWLTTSVYFIMTMLTMGWVIRLYLYKKTLQVNYYLKKVILK